MAKVTCKISLDPNYTAFLDELFHEESQFAPAEAQAVCPSLEESPEVEAIINLANMIAMDKMMTAGMFCFDCSTYKIFDSTVAFGDELYSCLDQKHHAVAIESGLSKAKTKAELLLSMGWRNEHPGYWIKEFKPCAVKVTEYAGLYPHGEAGEYGPTLMIDNNAENRDKMLRSLTIFGFSDHDVEEIYLALGEYNK